MSEKSPQKVIYICTGILLLLLVCQKARASRDSTSNFQVDTDIEGEQILSSLWNSASQTTFISLWWYVWEPLLQKIWIDTKIWPLLESVLETEFSCTFSLSKVRIGPYCWVSVVMETSTTVNDIRQANIMKDSCLAGFLINIVLVPGCQLTWEFKNTPKPLQGFTKLNITVLRGLEGIPLHLFSGSLPKIKHKSLPVDTELPLYGYTNQDLIGQDSCHSLLSNNN